MQEPIQNLFGEKITKKTKFFTKKDENKNALNIVVGGRVKAARAYSGDLTQAQLAERLYGDGNFPCNRISEIESGAVSANAYQLSKIAEKTGVSVSFLLGISPEPVSDMLTKEKEIATSIIQDTMSPLIQQLAEIALKSLPSVSLVNEIKKLHESLKIVRDRNDFDDDIIGGATLIKCVERCYAFVKKSEEFRDNTES